MGGVHWYTVNCGTSRRVVDSSNKITLLVTVTPGVAESQPKEAELLDSRYRRDFITCDNQLLNGEMFLQVKKSEEKYLVLCSAPSVPQPVVQSRRRPLLGPSPG